MMSDAAVKHDQKTKKELVDPTPLCLLSGGGHQHFLERLGRLARQSVPTAGSKAENPGSLSETECLAEALFRPWQRRDPKTSSFRWDPEEDVRYALQAGDPSDDKTGAQYGANRLAALGLAALTLVPEQQGSRVRPRIVGGSFDSSGFSFSWPIWSHSATLSAIRALLAHPDLRNPQFLQHLGVCQVMTARRIQVNDLKNFTRAAAAAVGPER